MPIINNVVVKGNGWETRIPMLSINDAASMVSRLCDLKAKQITSPQLIQDGDGFVCAWLVPTEVQTASVESYSTGAVSQESLMRTHEEMLKAQTRFYKSHTRDDEGWKDS